MPPLAPSIAVAVAVAVAGPTPAPTAPPPPDPALVEHNRRLTEQMHHGERWLIGGRIGSVVSSIALASGIALLAVYGYRKAHHEPGAFGGPPAPDRTYAISGGIMLSLGVLGIAASTTFSILGLRRIDRARRGELSFALGRGHAGLGYRVRF